MIYNNTVLSGFRQNHLTITLLKLKDDIIKVMGRCEVTLAVMTDFLKAFDTIDHCTVIKSSNILGFQRNLYFVTTLSMRYVAILAGK